MEEWYTGRRMTVVGVGVKHAKASFSSVSEGMTTTDEQCEYVGGKDIIVVVFHITKVVGPMS